MTSRTQTAPDNPAIFERGRLSGEYQRRRPEQTVLYQVVQENYLSFAALCQEEDRPLPGFIRGEFEKYLKCGQLCEGFARVHCGACGYDRFVAFSCKRRVFAQAAWAAG